MACKELTVISAHDQRIVVKKLLDSSDLKQHKAYLKNIKGIHVSVCIYSIEIIDEIYQYHWQGDKIPSPLISFFTSNNDLCQSCLGKPIFNLIMESINNFPRLSIFSVNLTMPEKSPLILIANFLICIVCSFAGSILGKFLKIDCNKLNLATAVFRITNQSLEYLLYSLHDEILNKDAPSDRFAYWKCSEKCQCLIEVRNGCVDIPYCQLCNRQLKNEKGNEGDQFIPDVQDKFYKPEAIRHIENLLKASPTLKINILYNFLDSPDNINSGSLKTYIFDLISLVTILFYLKVD